MLTKSSSNAAGEEKQVDASKRAPNDTIKILIGPNKQVFYVDQQLLINKVPYIRFQLKDDSAAIELPSIDVTGFRYVVHWLYNSKLPTLMSDNGIFDEVAFDATYKVADFLMISELKTKLRTYVCPLPENARNIKGAGGQPSSRS